MAGHDQRDFIQGIKPRSHLGDSETIQRFEQQEGTTTPREEATVNHGALWTGAGCRLQGR